MMVTALNALRETGEVRRHSTIYRTRPWGRTDQPEFYNAVAEVATTLSPRTFLAALQGIERRLGRVPAERWAPRAIDLDILTYDDVTIEEDDLHVPHRLLRERAFALVPLAELEERFAQWRDALDPAERESVAALSDAEQARFNMLVRESVR